MAGLTRNSKYILFSQEIDLNDCKKCEALMESQGVGPLWVLVAETQSCLWTAPDEIPEIKIQDAAQLGSYCCEEHALEAVNDYLLQVGATATWSDVRPIESCASCGLDFDTKQPHKVLVLSFEEVEGGSVQQLDVSYAARFCRGCVPA